MTCQELILVVLSKTLCLFRTPFSAVGKRLADFLGFDEQLNSKTITGQQDAIVRWILGIYGETVLLISPTISTATVVSKTLRRFLSLRRDIHMRAHVRAHGASNSKKSVLRLADARHVVGGVS